MADTKISALPAGAPTQQTDALPVARSGSDYKLTIADVLTADEHPTYSLYDDQSSDPSAPASGIKLYNRPLANRRLLRFIGPSGLDSALQPAFFANNVTMWLPGTGTTAAINFGVSWTNATTQAHPSIANTNWMTQMKRATYTTTTTAANASGVRTTAPICWIGSSAGQGGFFFAARFGILTYTSTMRVFVGLAANSTILAGDPSAQASSCGMSKDTGETVWQCLTVNATPAATKISTGRTTQAAGTTDVFDFYMFCKPNDTTIYFRVTDLTTGTNLVNNTGQSSTLPANNVMLYAHAECMNVAGGAGSSVAIFLNKLYIESDT